MTTSIAETSIAGGGVCLQYRIFANRTTGYLTFRGGSKKAVIEGSGIAASCASSRVMYPVTHPNHQPIHVAGLPVVPFTRKGSWSY